MPLSTLATQATFVHIQQLVWFKLVPGDGSRYKMRVRRNLYSNSCDSDTLTEFTERIIFFIVSHYLVPVNQTN